MPWRPGLLALALGLAGCVSASGPAQLTGSVTYRERIALPPGAVVNVMLLDVSMVGVAPRVVAKQEIRPEGQVPIPFVLPYDRAEIEREHRYGLRATITDANGRLLWINIVIVPVFREGSPDRFEIVVQRAHAMRGP